MRHQVGCAMASIIKFASFPEGNESRAGQGLDHYNVESFDDMGVNDDYQQEELAVRRLAATTSSSSSVASALLAASATTTSTAAVSASSTSSAAATSTTSSSNSACSATTSSASTSSNTTSSTIIISTSTSAQTLVPDKSRCPNCNDASFDSYIVGLAQANPTSKFASISWTNDTRIPVNQGIGFDEFQVEITRLFNEQDTATSNAGNFKVSGRPCFE
ncbi:uncharacterized protein UBRO_20047 [Ustilago bromivora]|uniref:Uncharacterized protein n=1 Tax=Ustilago bromivora TaxID=307758 RepID=A0A1K0HM32_9BASI|nr:uncharacterized protein UBRO_20047 [Ustilago bromivora]